MVDIIDIDVERRARERREELLAALDELAEVVDLARSRVRAGYRWSGTELLLSSLPKLTGDVRAAADSLVSNLAPPSRCNSR